MLFMFEDILDRIIKQKHIILYSEYYYIFM